ncbi:MAG: hypothetical protein P8168_14765 [Deltaproteobacteria bacterium]
MREKELHRVLQISPPAIPMWAVYYYKEDDSIGLVPVVTLAVIRHYESQYDEVGSTYIQPMIYESDGGVSQGYSPPEEDLNCIGFTINANDTRDIWSNEIQSYLEREQRRLAKLAKQGNKV